MGAKLEQGQYSDRFAFESDFKLMIHNAKTYNMPGSVVHNDATALDGFFDRRTHLTATYRWDIRLTSAAVWIRINKTLEEAAHKASQAQPAPVPQPSYSHSIQIPKPKKAPTPSATTPIILPIILKLGGGGGSATNGTSPSPVAATPKPAPKPKGRKPKEPKLSEVPPPEPVQVVPPVPLQAPSPSPAVEDVDDYLLGEVIAIEREAQQKKAHDHHDHRRHHQAAPTPPSREKEREKGAAAPPAADKGKERQIPKLVIGKRKKETTDTTEDEILALATPAKKERSSAPAPGPSSTPAPAAHTPTPRHTESPVPSRNGVAGPLRPKDRLTKPSPPVSVSEAVHTPPRVSIKGKEKEKDKESRPAPPANGKLKKPSTQATPVNEKKCRDILRMLGRQPEAPIFMRPVDPVLDGCPTYVFNRLLGWVVAQFVPSLGIGTTRRSRSRWTLAR